MAWTIELEGSIGLKWCLNNRQVQPYISLTSLDKSIMEKLMTYVEIGKICSYYSNNKLIHIWMIEKTIDVRDFILEVYPYLLTKQKRAKIVLDFCEFTLVNYRTRYLKGIKKEYLLKYRKEMKRVRQSRISKVEKREREKS